MTIYHSKKYTIKPDTPISIPNYEYENRTFYCNYCQQTLNKLIDSSGQNPSWFCNNCSIEVFPTEEVGLRSKSRLTTPEPNESPSISYPPDPNANFYKKKTQIRGVLKEMQKRGVKITSFQEKNWRQEEE